MTTWKQLSGERNWAGLLRPLKKDLAQTLIRYAKGVEAIYDTINTATGLPTYEAEGLFSQVGIGLYTMNKYVFSNLNPILDYTRTWIGFVAVATEEGKKELRRRDIMICWRGTKITQDWIKNLQFYQTSASEILGKRNGDPCVHKGFLSIYMSARDQVLNAVSELVNRYKNEEISITIVGHSMGSALATLNAADIVVKGLNKSQYMVTVFSFSSPKVGNPDFVSVFRQLKNLHLLQIRHYVDRVPVLPRFFDYSEVGIPLNIIAIDAKLSNALKRNGIVLSLVEIIINFHDLKNLIKLVEKQQERIFPFIASVIESYFTDNGTNSTVPGNCRLSLETPQAQNA